MKGKGKGGKSELNGNGKGKNGGEGKDKNKCKAKDKGEGGAKTEGLSMGTKVTEMTEYNMTIAYITVCGVTILHTMKVFYGMNDFLKIVLNCFVWHE